MDESDKQGAGKTASKEDYGYNLFPERRGELQRSVSGVLLGQEGTEGIDRMKCEKAAYKCFKTSKLVQLMAGALKASGCEIDLRRHIVCEVCDPSVSGGYDPETNQIVICQNTAGKSESIIQGILTHEMIHMFDHCNHKMDLTNIDHLACTEIRAANLTHCSFISAVLQGDAMPWSWQGRHQDCVRNKALKSILAVRKVSEKEAVEAINRVFTKCYKDLEPIGRRVKAQSDDANRAYAEGFLYGYV